MLLVQLLALPTDIIGHLTALNLKLLGKKQVTTQMHEKVKSVRSR